MPAAITHYLQCQRVLKLLEKSDSPVSVSREAYFWGAQGPDFFACHRFLPWWKGESLSRFGDRLHSAPPAETLAAMWRYVDEHPQDAYAVRMQWAFVSLCGGQRLSPFVQSQAEGMHRAEPSQSVEVCHNELESALI